MLSILQAGKNGKTILWQMWIVQESAFSRL